MRSTLSNCARGVGRAVLERLLHVAALHGYARVSLETGREPQYEPARRLNLAGGFVEFPPFADYLPDPLSVFMTIAL